MHPRPPSPPSNALPLAGLTPGGDGDPAVFRHRIADDALAESLHILPGDVVTIRRQAHAKAGEIVAVRLGDYPGDYDSERPDVIVRVIQPDRATGGVRLDCGEDGPGVGSVYRGQDEVEIVGVVVGVARVIGEIDEGEDDDE